MMVCPECCGKGYLSNNQNVNVGRGTTFTEPTQAPATVCPSCLGSKYTTQAGT